MVLGAVGITSTSSFAAQAISPNGNTAPEVSGAVHQDTSPPLRAMSPSTPRAGRHIIEHGEVSPAGATTPRPDGAIQSVAGPAASTTAGIGFAGVGSGDYGFLVNSAPPDTNGAVGATQYVEWVNESFAVFDKVTGALISGPTAGNALWTGFGGGCETNNDGDPVVQYDKAANRWVMTQFSVSTTPYLQCVAVSTTSDATGTYHRYSFSEPAFNDYPKLGVWPDGYYLSFNMFNGNSFVGGRACGLDRAKMLAGAAANQVCFQLSSNYGGLLPSDLDGKAQPPIGAPNVYLNFGANSLNAWKFHVDFTTPANSTFSGPTSIPVASFSEACGGGTCVPQLGTSQKLDSLADRLMYRLAYRNFGSYESWVVNHSVAAGTSTGVRWYELRNLSSTPTVYQQSTYGPTSTYRWMGSAAMDGAGDIAVGFSESSSAQYPAIAYAGRAASDPLSTLGTETVVKTGGGSQLSTLNRWGDYSAMTIDPVDDCTFWYANEYLKASGTFNWSTWITSFKFPGCGTSPPPAPTGLTATGGVGEVSLSWSASSGATSYDVYRSTSAGGEGSTPIATGIGSASYTDTTVIGNKTYYYEVTAVNAGGQSSASNEAVATPTAPPPPNPPSSLTATDGAGTVTLSWSPSSSANVTYNVYRGTALGGENATPYQSLITGTTFVDTGVTAGVTYSYTVAAQSGGVVSTSSNEASADSLPTAAFTYTCSGASCSFNATSSTDADTWAWTIGSTHPTGATTSYTFTTSGSYTVALTVGDTSSTDTAATSKTVSCSSTRHRALTCR